MQVTYDQYLYLYIEERKLSAMARLFLSDLEVNEM